MLNELLSLERGLASAGFDVAPRHADVATPGRTVALQVRLDRAGHPVELAALDPDRVAQLWTLRNGKHNSFPYVQLKQPLLSGVTDAEGWKEMAAAERSGGSSARGSVPIRPRPVRRPSGPGFATA